MVRGRSAAVPLLAVRGVSKRFGALQVLDDVTLRIAEGETVALVGDNGAGKSTLARCVALALRPDQGEVLVRGRPLTWGRDDAQSTGIGVVWQDLALCDNLDAIANLFLGRERHRLFLDRAAMHSEARALLDRVGIQLPDLTRPVASLSGGQRQALAVTRALIGDPSLLILDEPTAALGHSETRSVLRLLRELREQGTAMLLISHQLEHVFGLVDRIVVLRHGQVVADVSPMEVHPDDVVAMQSGMEADSTASRQLRRLGSLVEQLAAVEPTASLPLVVSAMTDAIGQEKLCVHLLDDAPEGPTLRRSAVVALPDPLLAINERLALGPEGGPVGVAAATGALAVSEDVRRDPTWAPFREAAAAAGILSSWAAPIVGTTGVLGAISGYGDTVGRLRADQLELITLYASHAATSIERVRVLEAQALRRSQRLQRDFLSRLSHELRTPLTAIHGYADSLRQPDVAWDDAAQRRFLDIIATESERMRHLVADLLDVSAIDSGVLRVHPDWCDLRLVVDASLAVAVPAEDATRVKVTIDDDVGPIWADHDRLEQVLVNLLENALGHTPATTQVRLHAGLVDGAGNGGSAGTSPGDGGSSGDDSDDGRATTGVAIRVTNDGLPIEAARAATLFEPHVSAGQGGGSGLGLPIARGIARAHGGDLVLDGDGPDTCFVVTLPVPPGGAAEGPHGADATDATDATAGTGGDDDDG
jgi:signal transduction histidine kinase/ABC-type multidrug transport system ATPase subunit